MQNTSENTSENSIINYNVDFTIRQVWLKLSRLYNQKAHQKNLTISTGFILLIIDKNGTPSTQLGPRMGMEPTSLSRTLKQMEDDGLIERFEDLVDKRKVLVYLTEKGLEKRRSARTIILDFDTKVKATVSKSKMKTFFEVLENLEGIVDADLKDLNS